MRPSKQIILITFLLFSLCKLFAQDSLGFSHNPFRDSTLISFDISSATKVSIIAYNPVGQKVDSSYKDTFLQSGFHSFFFGTGLPNNIYTVIYKINSKTKGYRLIKSDQFSKIHYIFQQNPLSVFPNPTQGNLNVLFEHPISKPVAIDIYDPSGRLVYTGNYWDSTIEINLFEFENGLYTLRIPDLGYSSQLVLMR